MIGAAHHVGHAHLGVVHHRGQRVEHRPILADQHRVRHRPRRHMLRPQDAVVPGDFPILQPEPPMRLAPLGLQRRARGGVQRQRRAVIDRRAALKPLGATAEVKLRRRLVAGIKPPRRAQRVGARGVAVEPVALARLAIPSQPHPGQIAPDRLSEALLAAPGVGVVQPQDEASAAAQRQQRVEQRGAQVAHVQQAGRRGRETGDDHRLLLRYRMRYRPQTAARARWASMRQLPLVIIRCVKILG